MGVSVRWGKMSFVRKDEVANDMCRSYVVGRTYVLRDVRQGKAVPKEHRPRYWCGMRQRAGIKQVGFQARRSNRGNVSGRFHSFTSQESLHAGEQRELASWVIPLSRDNQPNSFGEDEPLTRREKERERDGRIEMETRDRRIRDEFKEVQCQFEALAGKLEEVADVTDRVE